MDKCSMLCFGVLLAGACAGPNPYEVGLQATPPVATRDALVWIDGGHGEAVFVLPSADAIAIRRAPIGDARSRVAWTAATRDRGSVLALAVPKFAEEHDAGPRLHRLAGDGLGDPVIEAVDAAYTRISLSPDHRRGVLHFHEDDDPEQLRDAEGVAIVDLAGGGVQSVALDGAALRGVEFPAQVVEGEPGRVTIGEAQRDLAALLLASGVALIDMDDPTIAPVTVAFASELGFSPRRTLLRHGDARLEDPALLVQSDGAPSIAMLSLYPESDGAGFLAHERLLPVGQGAGDMLLHDTASAPYLITAEPAAGRLRFIDLRTQDGIAVELGAAQSRLFARDAARDGGRVRQVVAWAPRGTRISTLDLDWLEGDGEPAPAHLTIAGGVDALIRLDDDRALIASWSRLYVADLEVQQITPLSLEVPTQRLVAATVAGRALLWAPDQAFVGAIDLPTLAPASLLLDDAIESLHYLAGPDRVVVTHVESTGAITVIDPSDPARATSRTHWGFLLQGALDRP